MNNDEFRRVEMFVKERYGIDFSGKIGSISARMEQYLRMHNYADVGAFMDVIEKNPNDSDISDFLDIITTNHTFFMREFDQMEFFQNHILPEIQEKKKKVKDIRIWCAAASSGEEAYTIAMLLSDFFVLSGEKWETTILATDVSPRILERAIKGVYSKEAVENLPSRWKIQYFKAINEQQYEVRNEIRSKVLFREFNLMNEFPFHAQLDVIFMRNVMIYFEPAKKRELLKKIYNCLAPGGYLIIGCAETLMRDEWCSASVNPSIYQKAEEGGLFA